MHVWYKHACKAFCAFAFEPILPALDTVDRGVLHVKGLENSVQFGKWRKLISMSAHSKRLSAYSISAQAMICMMCCLTP